MSLSSCCLCLFFFTANTSELESLILCPLTTEGFLELLGELLNDTVALHIVHMVIQWFTGHLLQRAHVYTSHTDGKNLNACISCTLSHILHVVLRTTICHNNGNL